MAPDPIRLEGAAAKVEPTEGVDAAPSATTDAIQINAEDYLFPSIELDYLEKNERPNLMTNSLTPAPDAPPTMRVATIRIPLQLRGPGSVYSLSNLPEADPLFQGAAMARTDDFTPGAEKVTYTKVDTGHKSFTFYGWGGGFLYRVVGCKSAWTHPIAAGRSAMVDFLVRGYVLTDPVPAAVPALTFDASVPPASVNQAPSISGWVPVYDAAELVGGTDPQWKRSGGAVDGIESVRIPVVDPRFRITAEVDTAQDPYAWVKNRTPRTLSIAEGGTQYNRVTFSSAVMALTGVPGHRNLDGYPGWEMEFKCQDLSVEFS